MAVPTLEKTFAGFDLYHMDDALTDKQRALRDQVRHWVRTAVIPHINPYWEKAEFPRDIAMSIKQLPIIGGPLTEYGCAALDILETGLVAYELAKGDGSIGTFYGVHSGLAMGSIGSLGSREQQDRWMPGMVALEKIGAFGLTEPNVGSNATGIQTTARKEGDHYVLNGAKRWIGNASISQLLIIWARDEDGKLGGFVLEDPQTIDGVTINDIQGKVGKRAVLNADIQLENVRVHQDNRLANARSFRDTFMVLGMGRYGVAWEAAGAATAAFEYALDYAIKREQFGKPIAGFQLIQQKLVEMATEVTLMQQLCLSLARNLEKGKMTEGMVSMAKYNNAKKARIVTQLAREVMGGNGILIENHVARLWTDAEIIYTYEGTNEVNMLIVGRELTGINAIT